MGLRKQRRLCYTLEIAGLTIRYFAGPRPPSKALPGVETDLGEASTYVDVQAITGLTSIVEELRPFEGFVRHDPITVTLTSNSPKPRSSNDPALVFGRGRPEAATVSANLTVTLALSAAVEPGSPQTIYVDEPLSSLSFPRVVHIGREAMIATAAGGSQPDPLVADPYYIQVEERGAYPAQGGGVLDTRQQAHTVTTGGIPPVLTTPEITVWERRRAVLRVAEVSPSGTLVGDFTDIFVGFLSEEPDLSKLGQVQLKLSPLVALFDSKAAVQRTKTTLLDGVHEWQTESVGEGDPLPVGARFEHIQHAAPGDLYVAIAALDGDAGNQRIFVSRTGTHEDVFDVSLDDGEPRVGYLVAGPAGAVGLRPTSVVNATTFEVSANAGQVDQFDQIANAAVAEVHRADLDYDDATEIDYIWPQSLSFICESDWDYVSTQGADGGWLNVQPLSGDGFAVRPVPSPDAWGRARNCNLLWTRLKTWLINPGENEGQVPPDPAVNWSPLLGPPRARTPYRRQCWYPIIITHEEGVERAESASGREIYTSVPIGAEGVELEVLVADSWYQTGEPWALIRDPIDLSYTNTVRITFWEPVLIGGVWRAARKDADVVASSVSSTVLTSGETAYRLYWANPDSVPCFGNWSRLDDARPCEISAVPDSLRRVHPRTLLRSYLISPIGLNLGIDDVDLESIDRIEVPPSLSQLSLPSRLGEQPTIKDTAGAILMASLSALSMVRGRDGRLRLGVINIGREQLFNLTGEVEQGDWSVSDPPVSAWDMRTANLFEWSTRVKEDGKPDPAGTFTYEYGTLIDRYGVQKLDSAIRDIGGAPSGADLAADLLAVSYELALLYGRPRRLWVGGVGVHQGHTAYVGSAWLVSSDRLQSTQAGYGVSQLGARVIRREIDYWQEKAILEFSHHGAAGSGWNWSMDIEEKTSNTQFVVGLTTNSQAGDTDTRLFVAGMSVRIVPEYDEDSAVTRVIDSVTDDEEAGTSTVVVTAAWAGDLPARIEPMTYDEDSALVFREFAWVADEDGDWGAAGVPAKEIG